MPQLYKYIINVLIERLMHSHLPVPIMQGILLLLQELCPQGRLPDPETRVLTGLTVNYPFKFIEIVKRIYLL